MQHSYLLAGISSGKLFRLLGRNGFSLYPKYLFRILFLLQGSLFASIFNRLEKRKMAKKLENYSMPDDPVFIVGHWRTGSTFLHQLMALDENLVAPSVLQVSAPGSFLISEKYYKPVMSKLMKPTRPMDNVKLDVAQPQEDEYALIKLTLDSPLEKLIFPKNKKYFLLDDIDFHPKKTKRWKSSFDNFCRRVSFTTGKRLLLKNPFHSMRIPLLLEMYPRARFIHIHRHPYEVMPSTQHMWNIVGKENILKRKPIKAEMEDIITVFDRILTDINKNLQLVPQNAKVEIGFSELENNPVNTLKTIYQKLDLNYSPAFEKRVQEWLADSKSYKKNKYVLSASEKETIKNRLEQYFTCYNYK
jgi:hypothetical protein